MPGRRHLRAPGRALGGGLARARIPGLPTMGLVALFATGCATPGPLHVYTLQRGETRAVLDHRPDGTQVDVPGFLAPADTVTGFAYDPFTDHFFLRLAPGNLIRVVDRPARKIKREFTLEAAAGARGGDLTLRPADGHLFLLDAAAAQVVETSRLGKLIRVVRLADTTRPPTGIAYDSDRDQLLVLASDGRQITVHDREGGRLGERMLDREVTPSLAFDRGAREFYAPLRATPDTLGVFNEQGQLQRTIPAPGPFVDVGARSFVRVF